MTKEDTERLNKELDGGKAAVGIMAPDDEASDVAAKLAELGGKSETYDVSDEAIAEAKSAAEQAPEEAAEDAPAEPAEGSAADGS